MDRLNVPLKTRQRRLGHAQIETALKHYTHAIDAMTGWQLIESESA